MVIDARDQGCPKPVMMAEEALSKISEGIVEVIVDNEGSADNLEWFAKNNAFFSETTRDGKDWRVKIVKGYACAPVTATVKAPEADKDLFLVVGTDTMGKEETRQDSHESLFRDHEDIQADPSHDLFSERRSEAYHHRCRHLSDTKGN